MEKIQSYVKKTFEQYDRDHMACYLNEQQSETPSQEEGMMSQTVYEYDKLLVSGLIVSKPIVVSALEGEGVEELPAAVMASDLMFRACQQGVIEGVELDLAKEYMCDKISVYDSSSAVNEFSLNGQSMWLGDTMRTKLAKRFETDEADGLSVTKLIYEGYVFELPIETAKAMLHQLESYARDCFDKTNEHKAAVMAKRSVSTVLSYDYTVGYPEKLSFTLSE